MPEPVRQRIHAAAVFPRPQRFRVGALEVGDIAQLQLLEPAHFRLHHLAGEGDLQFAEIGAEGHLLLIGQRLTRKGQNGEFVHAAFDRRDLIRGDGLADIDAGDFADKTGLNRADVDRHERNPPVLL